jgi:hypothetical protein
MAYVRPTLVQGTGAAIGTANAALADVAGSVSWSTIADGSTLHYVIQDLPPDNKREEGYGTKTTISGNPVLQRTAGNVLGGSSGVGTLVNFTAGIQSIYIAPIGEVEVDPNVTADPTVLVTGQRWYRMDLGQFRGYVGSVVNLLSSADTNVAFTDAPNTFTVGQTLTNNTPLQWKDSSGAIRPVIKADAINALVIYAVDTVANNATIVFRDINSATLFQVAGASGFYQKTLGDGSDPVFTYTLQLAGTNPGQAGYGSIFAFHLDSSTNTERTAALITGEWATATDASRKGRLRFAAADAANSYPAREGLKIETDGSQALVGAFGVSAVAQQSIGAAATDAASTQTLANNIRTALINLGWCKT